MADNGVVSWTTFFLAGWGAPFTVYVIAQLIGVIHFNGVRRIVVGVPVPIMVVVAVVTFIAYGEQSNLWPIWMILVSPLALGYVAVVGAVMRVRERHQRANPGAI